MMVRGEDWTVSWWEVASQVTSTECITDYVKQSEGSVLLSTTELLNGLNYSGLSENRATLLQLLSVICH